MFLIRLKFNLYAIYNFFDFGVLVIAIITLNILKYELLVLRKILILKFYSLLILSLIFWKLNPRDRTITLTKLLIKHAKLTPKETEIGA